MAEKKMKIIGFRVRPEEEERVKALVKHVQKRNPHMDMSKVLREMIGLDRVRFTKNEDRKLLQPHESNAVRIEHVDKVIRVPVFETSDEKQKRTRRA